MWSNAGARFIICVYVFSFLYKKNSRFFYIFQNSIKWIECTFWPNFQFWNFFDRLLLIEKVRKLPLLSLKSPKWLRDEVLYYIVILSPSAVESKLTAHAAPPSDRPPSRPRTFMELTEALEEFAKCFRSAVLMRWRQIVPYQRKWRNNNGRWVFHIAKNLFGSRCVSKFGHHLFYVNYSDVSGDRDPICELK